MTAPLGDCSMNVIAELTL